MRLQVEQLEKEKKELAERVRVAAKRLDHLERAYRKEERPLLAKDYEIQQANDKAAHEIAQKSRIESARLAHQQDLETKRRLLRIVGDWKAYRDEVISRRGEEFAKRKEAAEKKIADEKAKKRATILKQREEERLRLEEEERIRREQEEEERQRLEGWYFYGSRKYFAHIRAFIRGGTSRSRRGGRRRSRKTGRRGEEASGRRESCRGTPSP